MRVLASLPHASLILTHRRQIRPLPGGISAEEATFATLAATALNGVASRDVV